MATLRRSIVTSILFTLFGGPGVVLLLFPFAITRFRLPVSQPRWLLAIAASLIFLGLVPLLESIVRFVRIGRGTLMPNVPTERLVASGLYRWVRNPMYVGDLAVLLGEALLFQSRGMLLYILLIAFGFHLFIRHYEEPTLRKRHGPEYADYCNRVPRWWPRF